MTAMDRISQTVHIVVSRNYMNPFVKENDLPLIKNLVEAAKQLDDSPTGSPEWEDALDKIYDAIRALEKS